MEFQQDGIPMGKPDPNKERLDLIEKALNSGDLKQLRFQKLEPFRRIFKILSLTKILNFKQIIKKPWQNLT